MFRGLKSAWRTRSRRVPAARGAGIAAWPLSSYSSSTALVTTLASPVPYADDESRPRPRGDLSHSNHVRNQMLRNAFRDESPAIKEDVMHKLSSPFVPPARDYPLPHATKKSMGHALKLARVHVGFDLMPSRDDTCRVPDWVDIFDTLRRFTPKLGEAPKMAALRIVMPGSQDIAIENRKLEFVDSATALISRVYMAVDRQGPSSFFLRGRPSVLARAAEDFIAACKDIKIFKLGDVAAHDYETKRLWPVIADAPDGGSVVPADKLDKIWVHREQTKYWITRRYENTSKPDQWTEATFQKYVTTLACGRLRPHMALAYYGQPGKSGRLVDTEGVRVLLILEAFEDPAARHCITPSMLKMALAFMSHRGGHRASAERLFAKAEPWGLPMDTEVFNIMLQGYVSNHDVALFYKTLRRMVSRFFQPNARTWLLFLRLVQKDDMKKQVVAAMHKLGFFDDPGTRQGIGEAMAEHDAYMAFRTGSMLEPFMARQVARYGENWLTPSSLNGTLRELFRFWKKGHANIDRFRAVVDALPESFDLGLDTFNIILEYCADNNDWTTALWAIARMRDRKCEPDPHTYQALLLLARNSCSPCAFGIVLFYGVLARQLRTTARQIIDEVLTGKSGVWLWNFLRPRIFSESMARALEASPLSPCNSPCAGVEWAILRECGDDYTPVQSLGGALAVAIRRNERGVHRQFFGERAHPSSLKLPGAYSIKIYDLRRRRPVKMAHLDSCFDMTSMIRPRDPESDEAEADAGQKGAEATKDEADQDEADQDDAEVDWDGETFPLRGGDGVAPAGKDHV